MEQNDKLHACLNINRRLPITKIVKNTEALVELVPEYENELY